MKLQSVSYDKNNSRWYSSEMIPNNPRSVLIYTEEGGVAEGSYQNNKWIQFRWNCEVNPKFWREMPRYESQSDI